MSEAEEFDWGADLSEEEWRALALQARVKSELLLRFAVAKDRGCSDVEAAAQAGYSGSRDVVKGSGHRAKKSTDVVALLALAEKRKAELGAGDPEAPNREARRRMLGRLTRSRDPNIQKNAIDALNKMDAEDRAMRAADEDIPQPAEVLRDIAVISPVMAVLLSDYSGVEVDLPGIDPSAVQSWLASCPFERKKFAPFAVSTRKSPVNQAVAEAAAEIGGE